MENATAHIPVMRNEVVDFLCFNAPGTYLDCTLGGGGHTEAILMQSPGNKVIACDRDSRAIARAKSKLGKFSDRIEIRHISFDEIGSKFSDTAFQGVLADLGISTDQLQEGRGFSFQDDSPLDMRMNEEQDISAQSIVNELNERDLYIALREGGVGPEANLVARAIVRARPIESTKVLGEVIERALHGKYRNKTGHPATVVFQALRMKVNDERSQIEALLEAAPRLVKSGGRFVVITFHSIEDKLVTHAMREWESGGEFSASSPGSRPGKSLGKMLQKKAVVATDEEIERNPSARSARIRVFEFH